MWKKKTSKFPGGIHPTDGYDRHDHEPACSGILAKDCDYFIRTVFWRIYHRLLVKPKDKVKAGDLIGTAEAFMAAPHASVTRGEVLEVKEVMNQGEERFWPVL